MSTRNHCELKAEIASRAANYLNQSWLEVDFYRIRRRLAFPVPLVELPSPECVVRGIPSYPWETWILWSLEERLLALGWHAGLSGDEKAAAACVRELEALAGWSVYRTSRGTFLAAAHAVRLLLTSLKWSFVPERLAAKVRAALVRLLDEHFPLLEERYGQVATCREIVEAAELRRHLANIPFIGLTACATAAVAVDDPRKAWFFPRLEALVETWSLMQSRGATEGVAYDGYIVDFLWDSPIAEGPLRPRLETITTGLLQSALALGAPGNPLALAELSDVEPVEMRFYLSALAKLHAACPQPGAEWLFSRVSPGELRVDTLVALRLCEATAATPQEPPVPGDALDTRYAFVLRHGWAEADPAVAIGCGQWEAGHLHCDTGSLCIGRNGRWLITDAGYQQYMRTSEREFTLGKWAHNAAVVNGHPQHRKLAGRKGVQHGKNADGSLVAAFDLGDCYPPEAALTGYRRSISLQPGGVIEVRDEIEADGTVAYCWLGAVDAAWMVEENTLSVCLPRTRLRLSLEGEPLGWHHLIRPPGSRGSQALYFEKEIAGRQLFLWRFEWNHL